MNANDILALIKHTIILRYLILFISDCISGDIGCEYQWHTANQLEYDRVRIFRRILSPGHNNHTY